MSKVISYVADMTRQRDRHVLEASLANVLFKLLAPTALRLWRVLPHTSGKRAQLIAGIRTGEVVSATMSLDVEDWPLLDDLAGIRDCWYTGASLTLEPSGDVGARHFLPMASEKELIGVLEIEAQGLNESQLSIIDGLLTIYRNHLALLDYSEHDELTGLLNRKTFEGVFAKRAAPRAEQPESTQPIGRRALRPGATPWLVVVDIDHFKRINDNFGHVFGDEVLLLLARIMRSTFRVDDAFFRFGGEEFAVLLAPTDRAGATVAVERFRAAVESYSFPQVGSVTVSVGYTAADANDGAMATFERADAALYFAKQHGRNQARCYEGLVEAGALTAKVKLVREVELF